jgi:hypothetical protein
VQLRSEAGYTWWVSPFIGCNAWKHAVRKATALFGRTRLQQHRLQKIGIQLHLPG